MIKKILALILLGSLTLSFLLSCSIEEKEMQNPLNSNGAYIFVRDNTEKITRNAQLTYTGEDKLSIFLARNESEGAQFIINCADKELKNLSVSVSELVCAENGGTIPSDCIEVYRQYYHNIDKVFDGQALLEGYYPDALLNLKKADNNISVPAGNNQGYWITVKANESTLAGLYKGIVSVSFEGGEINVPFECNVWDFTISSFNHLRSSWGMGYFNKYEGQELQYNNWLNENYRVVSAWSPYSVYTPEFMEYLKRDEVTDASIWIDLSYDEETKTCEIPQSLIDRINQLREAGVLHKIHTSLGMDEPPVERYDEIIAKSTALKKVAPDLPIVIPITRPIPANISDTVDWCIKHEFVDKDEIAAQHEKGLEVWWYNCNFPVYPCPSMHINDYMISPRIIGWMADEYDIDGFLYWNICVDCKYNYKEDKWSEQPRDTFNDVYSCDLWPAGDGCLVYQGLEGDGVLNANEPIPSLRLEAYRDGMEDYEYLYLLREKYEALSKKWGIDIDVSSLLDMYYDNLYDGTCDYLSDGKRIQNMRKAVAKAIMEEPSFLVSVQKPEGNNLINQRNVTVYAKDVKSVTLNGSSLEKSGEGIYKIKINTSDSENTELNFSVTDKIGNIKTQKVILYVRSIIDKAEIIKTPVRQEINANQPIFKIRKTSFDNGIYRWSPYESVQITITNNGNEDISDLNLSLSFRSSYDVKLDNLPKGESATFEVPLLRDYTKTPVSSLSFWRENGGNADLTVEKIVLVTKEK